VVRRRCDRHATRPSGRRPLIRGAPTTPAPSAEDHPFWNGVAAATASQPDHGRTTDQPTERRLRPCRRRALTRPARPRVEPLDAEPPWNGHHGLGGFAGLASVAWPSPVGMRPAGEATWSEVSLRAW
jgi:hypothetical protein